MIWFGLWMMMIIIIIIIIIYVCISIYVLCIMIWGQGLPFLTSVHGVSAGAIIRQAFICEENRPRSFAWLISASLMHMICPLHTPLMIYIYGVCAVSLRYIILNLVNISSCVRSTLYAHTLSSIGCRAEKQSQPAQLRSRRGLRSVNYSQTG